MKLEQSFEVQAPIDQVWAALVDLERVAPCLPGASITGRDEDGTYHGTFQVKLGPTTAAYNGTIRIEDADESAHRATLQARGTDKRGQGGASATIVNTLSEAGGATRVDAVTDFTITGRLAAFGRGGMIKDISNRLMRDFATCLQSRLAEGGPPAPPAETAAEALAGDGEPERVGAAPAPAEQPDATGGEAAAASSQPDATAGGTAATLHPGGGPRATGEPAAPPAGITGAPPPPPAQSGGGAPRPSPAPSSRPPEPSKPVNGLSLFFGVLLDRIKRLFGRG